MPKNNTLPAFCYVIHPITESVVIVRKHQNGYEELHNGAIKGEDNAKRLNDGIGVTPAQASAMITGSMFGWNVPGAKPDAYNEDGTKK